MSQFVTSGIPVNLTASGAVSKVAGTLIGIYVNSTSSGTIVVGNGSTSAATAVTGTITPAIGYHPMNMYLTGGCYLTLGSTINVTAMFAAG